MVNFFNELGKHCELTVVFEKNTSSERDDSWKSYKFLTFKGIILKGFSTAPDAAFCPQILNYLRRSFFDHIVVSNPCTPTGIIAIEYMKVRNISYMIQSEGGFAKSGKGLKEKFKRHLFSNAKLYLSTTEVGDEYFIMYGADRDRIVRYPFTSLFEKDVLRSVLTQNEKADIKQSLGITVDKCILTVGRFIHCKGIDVLLRACQFIDPQISVYIIGGAPTQEYLDLVEKFDLHNVFFLDHMTIDYLIKYYKAADIFVLPTREDTWGLVINEAMAYGLPIVTTDRCIAGLALVENNENGFIVSVEDEISLADRISQILSDDALRITMAQKSLLKIKDFTIENMSRVHMDIFEQIV